MIMLEKPLDLLRETSVEFQKILNFQKKHGSHKAVKVLELQKKQIECNLPPY